MLSRKETTVLLCTGCDQKKKKQKQTRKKLIFHLLILPKLKVGCCLSDCMCLSKRNLLLFFFVFVFLFISITFNQFQQINVATTIFAGFTHVYAFVSLYTLFKSLSICNLVLNYKLQLVYNLFCVCVFNSILLLLYFVLLNWSLKLNYQK